MIVSNFISMFHNIDTKIARYFDLPKDRFICEEFLIGDKLYILSDEYTACKILMKVFDLSGNLIDSVTFSVDYEVRILGIRNYVIINGYIYAIFVNSRGTYLGKIDVNARYGCALAVLSNYMFTGSNILQVDKSIVIFGGVYLCGDSEFSIERLYVYNFTDHSLISKTLFQRLRKNALVYLKDDSVYIEYGINEYGHLVDVVERFKISELFNEEYFFYTEFIGEKRTEDSNNFSNFFGRISQISYLQDSLSDEKHVCLKTFGIGSVQLDKGGVLQECFFFDKSLKFLKRHGDKIIMMLDGAVVFLEKVEPTLLNLSRFFVRKEIEVSGDYLLCDRVEELLFGEHEKCTRNFYLRNFPPA